MPFTWTKSRPAAAVPSTNHSGAGPPGAPEDAQAATTESAARLATTRRMQRMLVPKKTRADPVSRIRPVAHGRAIDGVVATIPSEVELRADLEEAGLQNLGRLQPGDRASRRHREVVVVGE